MFEMPRQHFRFSTKAENLQNVTGHLRHAAVLPIYHFSVSDWKTTPHRVLQELGQNAWFKYPVIVRSSVLNEDTFDESKAGQYLSVGNITSDESLLAGIERVIDSYTDCVPGDQILVQPMLEDVLASGVLFTRDPNNASHYFVANYDDRSGTTDTVTGGQSNDLRVYYHAKCTEVKGDTWLEKVLLLGQELEQLFQYDALDIEFAVTKEFNLYLLQVRPLILREESSLSLSELREIIENSCERVRNLSKPHPYLQGQRSVFGVMPDWNPAEIIGIKPRPLAYSLYRELITDSIWAYQRNNYGYKNLRSFPLMISLGGIPYIDVRVSFNSFVPKSIDDKLTGKLVNYYIDRLCKVPSYHDKVEFEIIYSCYTLDLPERLRPLLEQGFTYEDTATIIGSLRRLTNNIINRQHGIWEEDTKKIDVLCERQKLIEQSDLDYVEKIYWLLEDCKRHGTLPFAGLARAGFIAVQMLRSLVTVGVLSTKEMEQFLTTLSTVSSGMTKDFHNFTHDAFLRKYGHLRPGTYDILSPRYDEAPDFYFDLGEKTPLSGEGEQVEFKLSLQSLNLLERLLKQHQLEHDVLSLFQFIKLAIEGREYAKFVFTRSVSLAIALLSSFGERHGFSKEEMSYVNIDIVKKLYGSSESARVVIQRAIEEGREHYRLAKGVNFPQLVTSKDDLSFFHLPMNEPNFVTLKSVSGPITFKSSSKESLKNSILVIPSADPGYDWVFSHAIKGFITKYGGANSHMAIRASELGIPAVIGAGEALFARWSQAKTLSIDCANRRVNIIK